MLLFNGLYWISLLNPIVCNLYVHWFVLDENCSERPTGGKWSVTCLHWQHSVEHCWKPSRVVRSQTEFMKIYSTNLYTHRLNIPNSIDGLLKPERRVLLGLGHFPILKACSFHTLLLLLHILPYLSLFFFMFFIKLSTSVCFIQNYIVFLYII